MCIWFKIHDITQCLNNYIFATFLDKTVFYNMIKGFSDTIVLILWKDTAYEYITCMLIMYVDNVCLQRKNQYIYYQYPRQHSMEIP